jgi:hypothetical protein
VFSLTTQVDKLTTNMDKMTTDYNTITSQLTQQHNTDNIRNQNNELEFTFTHTLVKSPNTVNIIRDWVYNDSNQHTSPDPTITQITRQLRLQRRPLVRQTAVFEANWQEIVDLKNSLKITHKEAGQTHDPTLNIYKMQNVYQIKLELMTVVAPKPVYFSYVCTFCVFNSTTDQLCTTESYTMNDKLFFEFDLVSLFNYVSKKDKKLKILVTYFYTAPVVTSSGTFGGF